MSDPGKATTPRTDTPPVFEGEPVARPAARAERRRLLDEDHAGTTQGHKATADRSNVSRVDPSDNAGEPATLIAPEQARGFQARWNELKGEFVDEPRRAVRQANELGGEVLDELERLFRDQRGDLERGLDDERTSTEDLRIAFGRYHSFFDRLLSF